MTFFVWGWWRGCVRQLVALVLVLLAIELANLIGSRLEPVVAQVADPGAEALPGAAWAATCALLLVVFHVLLRVFGLVRPSPAFPRPASRLGGSVLGGLRGVLLLVLAGYVLLGGVLPRAEARRLGAGSHVLALLPAARRRLGSLLGLPERVGQHARAIEAAIPPRR